MCIFKSSQLLHSLRQCLHMHKPNRQWSADRQSVFAHPQSAIVPASHAAAVHHWSAPGPGVYSACREGWSFPSEYGARDAVSLLSRAWCVPVVVAWQLQTFLVCGHGLHGCEGLTRSQRLGGILHRLDCVGHGHHVVLMGLRLTKKVRTEQEAWVQVAQWVQGRHVLW